MSGVKPSPSIEAQRAFYDERWQNPPAVSGPKLLRCVGILKAVASLGVAAPRIVDLGCGTGWLTNILGTVGTVLGVDLSEGAIRAAAQRHPHLEFISTDILQWRYPENAFDIVVSQEVLEHVDVDAQDAYLAVAHGLLKKGGHLILTTPNRRTFEAVPEDTPVVDALQPIENWLYAHELKNLLRQRFRDVRVTTLVPGRGVKGSYRVASSYRIRRALDRIGMRGAFEAVALRAGFGLNLLAIARKE